MIKLLRKHKFAHLIDKGFLAHTVRHLCNNNCKAAVLLLFNVCYSTNRYRTTTSFIGLLHRCATVNFSTRWEIWTLHVFHELFERDIWVVNLRNRCIDHLAKVVRRNVGCHTDCDTHLTIQENVWHCRWQYYWLLLSTIKVIAEINGVLLNIGKEFCAHLIHASLSVT